MSDATFTKPSSCVVDYLLLGTLKSDGTNIYMGEGAYLGSKFLDPEED